MKSLDSKAENLSKRPALSPAKPPRHVAVVKDPLGPAHAVAHDAAPARLWRLVRWPHLFVLPKRSPAITPRSRQLPAESSPIPEGGSVATRGAAECRDSASRPASVPLVVESHASGRVSDSSKPVSPEVSEESPTYELSNDGRTAPTDVSAGNEGASGDARPVAPPPTTQSRLRTWLLLATCLVLACPVLLIDIGGDRQQVTQAFEAREVATSIQTWRRCGGIVRGASGEMSVNAFVPIYNGKLEYNKPPGNVWWHMLVFSAGSAMDWQCDVQHLVTLARLSSVFMALVALVSVYWAGHSIGGTTTAVLAGLIFIANPWLIWYGRLGAPIITIVAWTMLSMGAGLWALRPMKPAPPVERQFIGWVVCGLAMGLASLCAAPSTLLVIVGPLLVILVLCPNRISHLLGLIAASLIGVLVAAPWRVYTALSSVGEDQAVRLLDHWWSHSFVDSVPGVLSAKTLLIALLIGALPWTLWLISAVGQPFSTSSSGLRRRMWLGPVWFVMAALTGLVIVRSHDGELLLLWAPVAVSLGQLFRQYSDLASVGRSARLWRLVRWPHLFVLTGLSLALPVIAYYQDDLVAQELLAVPIVSHDASFGWPYWLGLGVVLVGIVAVSLRWAARDLPARSVAMWSLWMIIAMVVFVIPYARGPNGVSATNTWVSQARLSMADRPIFWLDESGTGDTNVPPQVALYMDRPVPTAQPDQIDTLVGEHGRLFFVGPPVAGNHGAFRDLVPRGDLDAPLQVWQVKSDRQ